MIERMTEKTRANLSKEGSVLKKIRIYGGIPMAIMAGGVGHVGLYGFFMRHAYYYGCCRRQDMLLEYCQAYLDCL